MYDVVCINSKNSVVWLSRMASVNLSPELKYWLFNMLFILYVLQVMVPLGSCELVPAMFDPVTKKVYYNPQAQSQVSGADTNHTLGARGYFFLMDTDGSRRSRVNEAQSAEEKKRGFIIDKKKNPLEPRVH